MKFKRAIMALAGLLSLSAWLSIKDQKQLKDLKVQALVEKLTQSRLMDQTSATELANSLSSEELSEMMDAYSNPRLQAAIETVAIVRTK